MANGIFPAERYLPTCAFYLFEMVVFSPLHIKQSWQKRKTNSINNKCVNIFIYVYISIC